MEQPLGGLAAVAIKDVHPSPRNPRVRLVELDELALSIQENGLIQPLVVQKVPGQDGYMIVAGHRRHAAVRKLGWAKVPVIIRRDMLPDDELVTMLVENGQRADLDPIEEARALQKLRLGGLAEAEVARRVGRSVATVKQRLTLLNLSAAEQEAVRQGHYSLKHAGDLIRAGRAAERERANPVARPVGRPKGTKTKPYFGDTHPLAEAARARCDHRGSPKVNGVACGSCWEAVIRADETSTKAQIPTQTTAEETS